jgi:hypothetical protein
LFLLLTSTFPEDSLRVNTPFRVKFLCVLASGYTARMATKSLFPDIADEDLRVFTVYPLITIFAKAMAE